jgi:hypothetical protein
MLSLLYECVGVFADQDCRASPGSPGLLCTGQAMLAGDTGTLLYSVNKFGLLRIATRIRVLCALLHSS